MLRRSRLFHCSPASPTPSVAVSPNSTKRYDVCVIGGGPAGVAAALRAADYNKKVCLIEKNSKLGGADAWNGALQSKTMWEMSYFMQRVRSFSPRVFSKDCCPTAVTVSEDRLQESLFLVANKRANQMKEALDHARVTVERGTAHFTNPNTVEVTQPTTAVGAPAAATLVEADYFVVATGSTPRSHPMIPFDGKHVVSSDEIMMQSIPESLVIIGAGVIGCEFASIFANFGKTQVNVIEKAPRLLPNEDDDIAMLIETLLRKRGCKFHHCTKLNDLKVIDDKHVRYSVESTTEPGRITEFEVERALVSIGRMPYYDGLGLTEIGCKISGSGVEVDEWDRCLPHKHIYAVGDATLNIALVNKGESEASNAIHHMYSHDCHENRSLSNLSTIMFLPEEVAGVGLSERQCRKDNIAHIVAKYGYDMSARSIVMGNTDGFVKIIVSNDELKTVLGVRAVGAHASSIIELASLAIHRKASAYELSEMATAYPSVAQAFQECLRMLIGRSIFKPESEAFTSVRLSSWVPNDFSRGRAYCNTNGQMK